MDEKIHIIKTQTTYTDISMIKQKLDKHHGDEIKVIEEYLEIPSKSQETNNQHVDNIQQHIFREIRTFMNSMNKSN